MSSGMPSNPYGMNQNPYDASGGSVSVPPPNYLVQSILVTLCCCIPFGIVAIVYAAQVNGKAAANDILGAQESSRKAKMWCWIALGTGLVVNILVMVAQVMAGIAAQPAQMAP